MYVCEGYGVFTPKTFHIGMSVSDCYKTLDQLTQFHHVNMHLRICV